MILSYFENRSVFKGPQGVLLPLFTIKLDKKTLEVQNYSKYVFIKNDIHQHYLLDTIINNLLLILGSKTRFYI